MIPRRTEPVTVTTDENGDATAVIPASTDTGSRVGILAALIYEMPESGGYDDSVEISVVCEKTGIEVWAETLTTNASKTITGPTMPAYDSDGTARDDGVDIPIASEGLLVTIASGGNGLSGDFSLVYYDYGAR